MNNTINIDHDTYMMMYYLIRSHQSTKEKLRDMISLRASLPDGMPHGSGKSDPTLNNAIKMAMLSERIDAVEHTVSLMQEKYARGQEGFDAFGAFMDKAIFGLLRSHPKKDCAPSDKTWGRYRREFAWYVAKKLGYC